METKRKLIENSFDFGFELSLKADLSSISIASNLLLFFSIGVLEEAKFFGFSSMLTETLDVMATVSPLSIVAVVGEVGHSESTAPCSGSIDRRLAA